MLEWISEFFYDPIVFWTAPLALYAVYVAWRWLRRRFHRGR